MRSDVDKDTDLMMNGRWVRRRLNVVIGFSSSFESIDRCKSSELGRYFVRQIRFGNKESVMQPATMQIRCFCLKSECDVWTCWE